MDLPTFFLDTTRSDDPINSNTTNDPHPADQAKVVDFLTVQSLSFTVATVLVTGLWKVLQKLPTNWSWTAGTWVPVALSVIVVLALYLNEWDDLKTIAKRISGGLIGLMNALLLAGAALGINVVFP